MASNGTILRKAVEEDLPAINDIYNHYVMHSTATYQTEPGTLEERKTWFASHGPKHPVIVAEEDGKVVGWASASSFHPRAAYAHTVENSVYILDARRGTGLGRALLAELLRLCQELGHRTVIAMISADQQASLALHRKFGFTEAAHLREVGHKFGRWLDVIYLQKMLSER